MAMITNADIAKTIRDFVCTGKKLPREETIKTAKDISAASRKIFQDTVDIFAQVFVPQKISVDHWQQAATIAMTMTECGTLNVNIATPALMQAALKQVMQVRIEAQIAENNQRKTDNQGIADMQENSVYLLPWTYGHMAQGRPITPYKPTEEQFTAFCLENKISRNAQNKHSAVIRAYLNDCNYARKHGTQPDTKLFVNRETDEIRLEFTGGLAQQIGIMRRTRTA